MDWTPLLENAPLAAVLIYMHTTGIKRLSQLIEQLQAIAHELKALVPKQA